MKTLDYVINSQRFCAKDIRSLDILARELVLRISGTKLSGGAEVILAFLLRMADLGHFEHLEFRFELQDVASAGLDIAEQIVKEFVRTIRANQKLVSLTLGGYLSFRNEHLKDLLEAIEGHERLGTLKIEEYPVQLDPDFVWLERLLSRNPNIEVRDKSGDLVTILMANRNNEAVDHPSTEESDFVKSSPSEQDSNHLLRNTRPSETLVPDLKRKATCDSQPVSQRMSSKKR